MFSEDIALDILRVYHPSNSTDRNNSNFYKLMNDFLSSDSTHKVIKKISTSLLYRMASFRQIRWGNVLKSQCRSFSDLTCKLLRHHPFLTEFLMLMTLRLAIFKFKKSFLPLTALLRVSCSKSCCQLNSMKELL